ncbi:MAG: heme ABC exporter ATP-binding protein CcmA [Deferribacteraceae bacterium]|jgi:heme exporter protein A|nr:heme ABC exporter ATP-binding protein CcmA [Deferribacteraceae bacterium]
MNSNILSLDKISKKYGEKTVLKPLTLDIASGECITVFGPNGAGKSTLLKLLSQQTKPSSGAILYKGSKIKDLKEAYRAKLGVISHQPFLYEGLSAFENLQFYASLYGVDNPARRASELLTRVEMNKRMHDPVRTYSRGMLQRTSIARALLQNPEIIFLDEPYTGLDRHASHVLTGILKEQIEQKTTILLVTHDLSLGYSLASRLLIMSKGEMAYWGEKTVADSDFEGFYLSMVDNG